jgi:hypothetical protein
MCWKTAWQVQFRHLNFAAALAPLAGFSGWHRVLGGQPQTFPMLSQLTHFPSGPL